MPYANRLNADIAKTINADIVLVSEQGEDSLADLKDKLEIAADNFGGIKNPNVIGYILNKASAESTSKLAIDGIFQNLPEFARKAFQPLGCVPFDVNLASPRTLDIAEYLGATAFNAGEIDTRRDFFSLSARTASNMIHHLKPGNLVIAPGDRDDIVLATAMAALNGVPLAGYC